MTSGSRGERVVRPALSAYADPVPHVGALGAGQRVKLVNNALVAARPGLLAQAARLGWRLGVEEDVLPAALTQGSAAGRASAASAARGGVSGLVASAGAFPRKDLAVVAGLTGDLGPSLGPLEPAVRSLRELLPDRD